MKLRNRGEERMKKFWAECDVNVLLKVRYHDGLQLGKHSTLTHTLVYKLYLNKAILKGVMRYAGKIIRIMLKSHWIL